MNSTKEWDLTVYINYAIALTNKYNIDTAIVDILEEVNFELFLFFITEKLESFIYPNFSMRYNAGYIGRTDSICLTGDASSREVCLHTEYRSSHRFGCFKRSRRRLQQSQFV